ncbi:MAG: hypothetical protein VYA34_04095 [Myxococcota bacterium]|nr:hypothetical protein [Myxococcota bacterium]
MPIPKALLQRGLEGAGKRSRAPVNEVGVTNRTKSTERHTGAKT